MSSSIFRNMSAAIFAFLLTAAVFTGCDSKTENASADQSGNANTSESASELEQGLAAYKQKDYKTAFEHFKAAAEQGDAEAQYRLADSYAKAKGVDRDLKKGFEWMKKAAEQGYAKAQMCIGFYYGGGVGVRKDTVEAEKWIKQSFDAVLKLAEQGDVEAQLYLASYYGSEIGVEMDEKKALEWNRKAAENGNEQAQKNIGLLYLSEGKNLKEAVKWLRMAAENGEQEAPLILGLIYWGGDKYLFGGIAESTIAPDWNEAEKWFRTALNGPFAVEAKNALANMEEARKQGKGPAALEELKSDFGEWVNIPDDDDEEDDDEEDDSEEGTGKIELEQGLAAYKQKDYKIAFEHFKAAAEQGDAEAQYKLAMCYAEGKGVELDKAKSFDWMLKSANLGNPKAQCVVGMCYIGGNEVTKDEPEGKKWIAKSIEGLRRAAERGDADASAYLGGCYGDGIGVEKDQELSLKWIRAAADQGHSASQVALGVMMMKEKKMEDAVDWFRKAAENESHEAQFILGRIYENGLLDTQKDIAEAEKWYKLAAASPDPDVAKEANAGLKRLEQKK